MRQTNIDISSVRYALIKYKINFLEIEIIIAYVIGKTREFVITYPEFKLNSGQIKTIKEMAQKRSNGYPLAYLIGHKEFYGANFKVNKNVLIPRPETEIIIDYILGLVKKNKRKNNFLFYDIGTGSGCIIITLARLLGKKNTYCGSDISAQALKTAKSNAQKHRVDNLINFKKGHLAMPFLNCLINTDKTIFITANLPYLTKKQFNRSPTIQFEPKTSLISRENGLEHYRQLLKQFKILKNKKFFLLCEINPRQYLSIKKIARKYLPDSEINYLKDYSGRTRLSIMANCLLV